MPLYRAPKLRDMAGGSKKRFYLRGSINYTSETEQQPVSGALRPRDPGVYFKKTEYMYMRNRILTIADETAMRNSFHMEFPCFQ